MKRRKLILLTMVSLSFQVYGIGISPARWTVDFKENGDFNSAKSYILSRPSTQYSQFTAYQAGGLNVEITGCSASDGIEYLPDGSILIDWNSSELVSQSSINAYIDVATPDPWLSPVDPGNSYMADLVRHTEVLDPDSGIGGVVSVVSQINFYRNYALKGQVIDLQDNYSLNTPLQFGIDVTDYLSTPGYLKWFDFSYTIDWESDGIIDDSLSGIRMRDELGQTDGDSICAGFKYKTLDLEHLYTASGDYLVSINLIDHIDITTLQIPVHVIPEPATLLLIGLGSLFLRRKQCV